MKLKYPHSKIKIKGVIEILPAPIAEIDGVIKFGNLIQGETRKITIVNKRLDKEIEYFIPPDTELLVSDGDIVTAGFPLVDLPVNPHDLIKVLTGQKKN